MACHVLTAGLCSVLERVRAQIKARGAKTIRGLGRTFRNFDSFDGNHKIDRDEFYSGLCEIQIRISRQEADSLMALFDTDGDGCVNFDEFLVGIRVSFLPLTYLTLTDPCLSLPGLPQREETGYG